MCDRETPRAQRAMCGCYTRQRVATVVTAAMGLSLVVAALAVPAFELFAFVGAFVATVAVVGLAVSRGAADGGARIGWVTQPQRPAVPETLEEVRAEWWERARVGGEALR